MDDEYETNHVCEKATYKYVDIFRDDVDDKWWIDIDSQSSAEIFYCPFCGKKLAE